MVWFWSEVERVNLIFPLEWTEFSRCRLNSLAYKTQSWREFAAQLPNCFASLPEAGRTKCRWSGVDYCRHDCRTAARWLDIWSRLFWTRVLRQSQHEDHNMGGDAWGSGDLWLHCCRALVAQRLTCHPLLHRLLWVMLGVRQIHCSNGSQLAVDFPVRYVIVEHG